MKRFHKLLGAALATALAGAAYAQVNSVVQTSLSGQEVWRAAQGPGGPEQYLGIDTVRNGTQFQKTSGSGAATSTATGGTLMWIGTAPTTWAVTLPATPFPGQRVVLTTDTTLTSMVTVTAAAGSTLHATYTSQTLTALTPVVFQYQLLTTTWYRTQ
jgi:hypothetical protein